MCTQICVGKGRPRILPRSADLHGDADRHRSGLAQKYSTRDSSSRGMGRATPKATSRRVAPCRAHEVPFPAMATWPFIPFFAIAIAKHAQMLQVSFYGDAQVAGLTLQAGTSPNPPQGIDWLA